MESLIIQIMVGIRTKIWRVNPHFIGKKGDNMFDKEDLLAQYSPEYYEDQEKYPIKCPCGCEDTEQFDEYYEEYGLCEYKLRCKKCGTYLGIWAYGNWSY